MAQKKWLYISAAIIAAIIIILSLLFFKFPEAYRYSFSEQGIDFVSNLQEPEIFLPNLASKSSFIISPVFRENAEYNENMASALVTSLGILTANNKNVISIIRNYGSSASLVSCETNDGDVHSSRTMEKAECLQSLASANYYRFFIEEPNAGISQPKVVVEKDKLTVFPKNNNDIQRAVLIILKSMYKDSDSILKQINDYLEALPE